MNMGPFPPPEPSGPTPFELALLLGLAALVGLSFGTLGAVLW